eukprot:scaffold49071_cov54-Attheya_sp.AAC.4
MVKGGHKVKGSWHGKVMGGIRVKLGALVELSSVMVCCDASSSTSGAFNKSHVSSETKTDARKKDQSSNLKDGSVVLLLLAVSVSEFMSRMEEKVW